MKLIKFVKFIKLMNSGNKINENGIFSTVSMNWRVPLKT